MLYNNLSSKIIIYKETVGPYDLYEYIGEDFSRMENFREWVPGTLFAWRGFYAMPRHKEIFVSIEGSLCRQNADSTKDDFWMHVNAPIMVLYGSNIVDELSAPDTYYTELVDGV